MCAWQAQTRGLACISSPSPHSDPKGQSRYHHPMVRRIRVRLHSVCVTDKLGRQHSSPKMSSSRALALH